MISLPRYTRFFCLVMAQASLFPYSVYADDAVFDMDVLKERGLDPSIATYLSKGSKFTPGRKSISLKINGKDKGNVNALFGGEGQLCADSDFLQRAGLVIPKALKNKDSESTISDPSLECYDYKTDFPSAIITPLPGQQALALVVPEEALFIGSGETTNYSSGGEAGLFNYDLFTTQNHFQGGSSSYSQASLEEGFNIGDWFVRSRQTLSLNDGEFNSDSLYTFAQHTFSDSKKIFQVGQINIGNTLFSGAPIIGMQLIPDSALTSDDRQGVTVSGIARTAQARVEVRQSGSLVYSTLVPAGPFTLTNVPITQSNTALDVTVKEADGSSSHFIISAEAVNGRHAGGVTDFSIAVGQTRDLGSDYDDPLVAAVSDGWMLADWFNIGVGGMFAQKYTAMAASFNVVPFNKTNITATFKASDEKYNDNRGYSSALNASYSIMDNLYVSASATRYTFGYRELSDALQDDFTQYSEQYNANIGWSNDFLGAFTLGLSINDGQEDSEDSRYINLSWGRSFEYANVTVNWQRQVNAQEYHNDNNNSNYYNNNINDHDLVYVNVSIPIGKQHIDTYFQQNRNDIKAGVRTSGNIGRNSNYSLSAEQDLESHDNSFSGNLSSNLHYTTLDVGAGTDSNDTRHYNMALRGGVVASEEGITFSPYAVQDTFAVAVVGEKVSGVEISTPAGSVWTDYEGKAVIPSLPAYSTSRVEINAASLPENVDVNNGITLISAGRGSVNKIKFGVLTTRRVMLNVKMPDGKKIPKGSSVIDGQGNFITTAVYDGDVFVSDIASVRELYVADENGGRKCQINYRLEDEIEPGAIYENVKGVCK